MLNQVLESTLAFMVALLILSIVVIVRVRPAASPAGMATGQPMTPMPGEPMLAGNGLTQAGVGPAGNGQALWAAGPPPGLLAADADQRRAGLPGRRYEPRHVRGRTASPRQAGPSGPPWGPAAPPPSARPGNSDRWA